MQAFEEQQDIIHSKNNTIVVSNPNWKDHHAVPKVIKLLKDGARPESILCITFTNKAKRDV